MQPLTLRQQQILSFIRDTLAEGGIPPTIAEIAAAMEVKSLNGIRGHLQALARKGAIELLPGASRGIRLLGAAPNDAGQGGMENDSCQLPIVGRVAAGSPLLSEQHIEGHCWVGASLFKPRADYLLRVQGMSMRDAGIFDGDLLAVHRSVDVRNGQIVVARLESEVTVKRLRQAGHMVYLHPENPEFETIAVDTEQQELCIEGVVVGVIRH
ncbi:MAG: transcriptional repressor LexA [Gammaproteobacteria bacterium]|nr:transcriptional repressor LexA [Gammaproteobacteria bacterium]